MEFWILIDSESNHRKFKAADLKAIPLPLCPFNSAAAQREAHWYLETENLWLGGGAWRHGRTESAKNLNFLNLIKAVWHKYIEIHWLQSWYSTWGRPKPCEKILLTPRLISFHCKCWQKLYQSRNNSLRHVPPSVKLVRPVPDRDCKTRLLFGKEQHMPGIATRSLEAKTWVLYVPTRLVFENGVTLL